MTDRDSPPPSWYEPASDPPALTLVCRTCETAHDADRCPECGTVPTAREIRQAEDSLREDRG